MEMKNFILAILLYIFGRWIGYMRGYVKGYDEAKESYVLFYEKLRAIEEETFKNEIEKEWKLKEKELKDI